MEAIFSCTLPFFAIFAWVFQREKARVINGFLFNFLLEFSDFTYSITFLLLAILLFLV
ncbi:hypothetical protein TMUPMC115_1673 [Tetragenococcus muriaticus PMC-11-5]|uniref:Uncharacterized protein n=1 Tax=Tetragenococcus muriaticus PMC-11-5 TaxID=1302649 RepID=A0A091C4B0_9ENTE|nr:hypothetical protein TMUPMC115_1673 [Tetragenococcus muriaticus PMC-11-5]